MKKIALISDTHNYFGKDVEKYINECDELWHAGDIGSLNTLEFYEKCTPVVRAVYGNIDDHVLRRTLSEHLFFNLEGINVLIIHIGGYPGRYSPKAKELISKFKPDLFISGHSHITRIIRDKWNKLLHMNPGSCGIQGIHQIRTLLRFKIESGKIFDVELIELGKRGVLDKK